MKTNLSLAPLLVLIACSGAVAQGPIHAKTDSGKDVILNPDGTWKYSLGAPAPARASTFTKPSTARKLFKPQWGNFGIWYDDTKWTISTKSTEPGRTELHLLRGQGMALVIVEEIDIPLENLKIIALKNAKEAAPDARIVFEEPRVVNGKEVRCMKMEGTIDAIPFTYYGYYYGGTQGTIQLLTFTGQTLFKKYEADFLEFLNGLEIY